LYEAIPDSPSETILDAPNEAMTDYPDALDVPDSTTFDKVWTPISKPTTSTAPPISQEATRKPTSDLLPGTSFLRPVKARYLRENDGSMAVRLKSKDGS
jgi:hypothetical protein